MGYVQSANNSSDAGDTSIAVTFGSNPASGNLICVHVAHGGTTDRVTSITDSLSTTYTERKFHAGTNVSGSLWSGVTTAAGANTVTANLSVSSVFRRIAVHEVSGFDVFDAANSARFAAGACGDSGDITPAEDGEYIFGAMHTDQGGDFTIDAGTDFAWTKREDYQHANAPCATEDLVQATATAIHADFTESSCVLWRIYYVMAFKAAADEGGGGGWSLMRPYTLGSADPTDLLSGLYYYMRRRRQGKPHD